MIFSFHFVPTPKGQETNAVEVNLPCLPRKGDIVQYKQIDYRVMGRRWYINDDECERIEVVLNPLGD